MTAAGIIRNERVLLPLTFLAALFLLATGRWGAYISIPGLPVYLGDVLLGLAAVQTVRHLRRAGLTRSAVLHDLGRAPLALLAALGLAAWAAVRLVVGIGDVLDAPLTAARDVAPFVYALVGLLSFLLPTPNGPMQRRLVYGVLTFHAAWIVTAGYLPGWPWSEPILGGAPILTPRPDIDSAVAGVAIALAVHEVTRSSRWPARLVLTAFVALNCYALQELPTRGGFLACVAAVAVVVGVRVHRSGRSGAQSRRVAAVLLAAALVGAITVGVVATPPGQRLVEGVAGLTGDQTQASGTVDVRMFVWRGVIDYTTADFSRSAMGVGFGRDFLHESNTEYALEGDEYGDVRSPHNVVLGTLARLGIAGSLLVSLLLVTSCWLAISSLVRSRRRSDTVDTLAAAVVLTTTVVSLVGVVLEAPFGAIPYFWAVGQLAHRALGDRGRLPAVRSAAARVPAQTVRDVRYQS
jgi:hypothetical protein